MAHTVQSVTLALTLPISCHICLGKVRQPVICVNHHVFCSVCIDLWLKNNSQCPVCRVPITPENPCKDIIGGASENEDSISHTVRKHLRKTRFELLHKEYEDEIESLIKETEELRRTNIQLEERCTEVNAPVIMSNCNCEKKQVEDKNICEKLLEDWNRKLEMMNAANKKVTEDIVKLKEENKRLKNENIECARENLRLKNEVELRSPQKFGRFTVAALQAKVEQYEREMSRLKKALERSDQYIEELEEQIVYLKKPPENKQMEKSQSENAAVMADHTDRPTTSNICQTNTVESCPKGAHEVGASSEDFNGPTSSRIKPFGTNSKLENGFASASWAGKAHASLIEDSPGKGMVTTFQDFGSPSSSLPFSSLQLTTPNGKANLKKPLTYLRKLTFDDLPKNQGLGTFPSLRTEQSESAAKRTSRAPLVVQPIFNENNNQPEISNENSVDSIFNGVNALFQGSVPDLLATDTGGTGLQDNITDSTGNSLSRVSVYPEEVSPQTTSLAHLEDIASLFLSQSYSNRPPAKRKLLN
ncbi:ORC ubiquitin ligase 1 [Gastrophryne carolinensis]